MKHLLLTTIAAVVLVGCGESQQSASAPEVKLVEPVAETAPPEPPTTEAPDISIREAVKTGNIDAVKQHLDTGVDVNAKDRWGMNPLHYAAAKGHKEIAELLIAKGADVNVKRRGGQTALDSADSEIADLLRKHGGKTGAELNALIDAVKNGEIEAVKKLLAAGADVNTKIDGGRTPLHVAAIRGHKEIAELLITKGADVNVKDRVGLTPLHSATTKEIAELLIGKGADVNAKSGPFRETPLHNAASGGHKEIVELLIAAGADVSAKGLVFYGERTPLHRAAGQGHKGIAELLIVEGADLNAKDEWEYTPLHNAASGGHKEIVELLIAKGADVNVKSNVRGENTNKTPLDWAIKQKHAETADLLRKHGGKTGEELKAEGN